jgi:hypothetical protein
VRQRAGVGAAADRARDQVVESVVNVGGGGGLRLSSCLNVRPDPALRV